VVRTYVRRQYIPHSPFRFVAELGHVAMVVYYALRLMINRKDTAPTYKYCWHLDQITLFRSQFQAYLANHPAKIDRWTKPRLFIDHMPDPEAFSGYPEASVGRAYYDMWKRHSDEGLMELRKRRLEVLPQERKGLDLEGLAASCDPDDRYERIVARRNIFMTSTHDFCHMLIGANTDVAGEALVARYQYHHLLVPQNWLNELNCIIVYLVSLRWSELKRIFACFGPIDRSANYADLDMESLWSRPIATVRKELGLPEEGFMPGGMLPQQP